MGTLCGGIENCSSYVDCTFRNRVRVHDTFRIKTGHQEIAISANFIRVPQIWDPFDSFALFHRFLPLQRSRFNTESTKSMSNDVFKLFRIFEHI